MGAMSSKARVAHPGVMPAGPSLGSASKRVGALAAGALYNFCLLPAGNQPCPLGSVEGFSLARRRWEALPAMPTARCSCSSLQAGPRLFVIGGVAQGPSQAVEALCLRDGV